MRDRGAEPRALLAGRGKGPALFMAAPALTDWSGKAAFCLLVLAALLLSGCNSEPAAVLRYRVTVEVNTPQGLRTGSGVWELSGRQGVAIPGPEAGGRIERIKAEAIAVDLPGGKLFVPVSPGPSGNYPAILLTRHLADHPIPSLRPTTDWQADWAKIRQSRISFELAADEYPMLVTFADLAWPGLLVDAIRSLRSRPGECC